MGRDLDTFIIQNYKKAMEYHEIQTFYQPVIRTSSGQLCSFEALARWIDPKIGTIYPNEFIPVLEREGLIHLLDLTIIRQVCARLRASLANGEPPIPVSVNLSRLDFTLCDIFTAADDIVSDYQIPHDFIYFEITESVIAEEKELMKGIVEQFRCAGYQIWMDDFGSAYSSLNVLKEFSFDELKLDMSFLRPFNLRSRRIVTAMIRMAKDINIHTLAEGVETEEQFVFLRDIGCEKVQGYYFGKPMPFEDAVAGLGKKEIEIEAPQDRTYYDDIGTINFLSAVPFMTREEKDSLYSARQLNSIPLMLAEFSADFFKVLFYNTEFEKMTNNSGMFNSVFTQETLCKPQPYRKISKNIINLMDAVRAAGEVKKLFAIHDKYFEITARCMTQTKEKYCVLVRVTNLTNEKKSDKTGFLDDSVRQIYALYDRVTVMNYAEDSITPLYTDKSANMISGRQGIKQLVEEYAEKFIFPEDKDRFAHVFDPKTAVKRLTESASISFSEVFRTGVGHGNYAWFEYTLLHVSNDDYFLLVLNIHDIAKDFIKNNAQRLTSSGPYSPEQLWSNLTRSSIIRVFWKDQDRRFLGASKGFLDFYGFSSANEIIGRNDEELGWHVHPDLYMNDEYKVINEGVTIQNIPGKCISHGENIDILASKTPLYDENGKITGLLGCFIDKESLSANDQAGRDYSRRELLTGLLNSRGISEQSEAFYDEYYLRGTDFVRFHIGINDFSTINEQYGFDFGDKVLYTFGSALSRDFGLNSAIGRYAGRKFIILQQVGSREEARELCKRIKSIADSIRHVDGKPITLYLSVGYALFSESLDLNEQAKSAEMRLHADHDKNISAENRIEHASELFSLFDDLPVIYSVYHVTHAEHSGQYDAVFFYVNRKYEDFARLPAKALVGHTVRDIFPFFGEDWYFDVKSAALDGKIVEGEFDGPLKEQRFRFTARQILYPGYCAITCTELPVIKRRRYLLIADDAESNRRILGSLLCDEYEIYYACDGVETMELLQKHKDEIALVILDLYMPNMSGQEVLARMKHDDDLMFIPTIVLTDDQDAELDCLKMGAMDFIPKPYPDIKIVKASIAKCIEMSENRELIRNTYYDKLTGLLNADHFMQYVTQYDQNEKGTAFDAYFCDVNRFSEMTKLHGQDFSDRVLHCVGAGIKSLIRKTGGIGCRKEGDTFLFYCPHQNDHERLLRELLDSVSSDGETAGKFSLRLGVYLNAQQEPDIDERFDRAKAAADSVRDDPQKLCGFWEET